MPSHRYVKNGHRISIDVEEDHRGVWPWTYTINGSGLTELRDRHLRSERMALLEAQQDANKKAERLPRGEAG